MARLNYSASVDELEQMAGALETRANIHADNHENVKAAFFFGAAAGIDQLTKLGKPEDATFRVMSGLLRMEELFNAWGEVSDDRE